MADGAEMDEEAMRAFFPLSFGKAPARPGSAASSAHSSTLRKPQNPSNPKSSASTAADDDSAAMIGPPRPPPASAGRTTTRKAAVSPIGPPRPPPPSARGEGDDDDGDGMIGPPRPPPADDEDVDDDDGEDEEEEMEDDGDGGFNRIPLSNEIVLRGHTKVVSALAVDHTGSRVLSGSYDYTVRMYDFQGGEWNPKSKETILTSSEDGSIRLWDVSDFKSQKQVIKPKLVRPMRIPVTSCAWDHEGKRIVGGIGDGSIQVWTIKAGWGSRPDIHVEKTHTEDITGVKFSTDGQILLSRSMDSTLKIWDLRRMKTPLKVFEDLPNHYAETNAAFSSDEQLIFTGTSIEKDGDNGGLLCFFDRKKLELVSRVGISPQYSVIRCLWHPRINQVFATVGDKKEGGTHILYDPSISQRGALVCVGRAPRKKSVDDFEVQPVIHNPHALPLFRDQPSRKRQREKILKDPLKSHKPEAPVNGPGYGGRVGTTKGSLLTQYLLKEGGLIKETWMNEDPREAILKYADAAEKDPKFIAPAYSQTQPKPVFAESDSDNEEK
ncbi:unnamed protein product [Miscanthus lutarioriparius]|uniref:Transducin/WD40 repeat-like superfamily protein n=1 Tax=Miscanthus lutarioriparius TaxID=422564 RepID=A0A811SHD6_9POAL|nr:unnamed protein product [Miscanthus lutarioriparius]